MGRKEVPTDDPQEVELVFPLSRPDGDPNIFGGKKALSKYYQLFLAALRGATKEPMNLSKVLEVRQLADESPSAFLECLLEAYRLFTPIDSSVRENARAINMVFVSQSAPDAKKKLQKLKGCL